jgi:hypothetical protein
MANVSRQITLRAVSLTVMALTSLTLSRASVIQSTVMLPPVSGEYTLGGVCVSALGRCTQNAMVSNFDIMTSTVDNGNEFVVVGATYSADIFTDSGGLPGAFLGHLSLSGTAHFTYLGRDPGVNPLGTFTTELTDFAFQGMLNGNTFEVKQDPGKTSTGWTTILEATDIPPITYAVSSSLEIFALYSFNGSPFMTAPPRTADLNPVPQPIPEPGSGVLVGTLVGVVGIASRCRRVR